MGWLETARQRLTRLRGAADDGPAGSGDGQVGQDGQDAVVDGPAGQAPTRTKRPAGTKKAAEANQAAGAEPTDGTTSAPASTSGATTADAAAAELAVPAGTAAPPPLEPAAPATVQFGPGLERVGIFTWLRLGFFVALGVFAATMLTTALSATTGTLVRTLIAIFLAVSLDPLVRALARRGLPRPLAVIVILTGFIALITMFLLSVIPPLIDQINQFAEAVPDYISNLQQESQRFRDLNEQFDITGRLEQFLGSVPANLAGNVVDVLRGLFGAVGSTLLVIVLTIYFLLDLPRLRRSAPRLMPLRNRARFAAIVDLVIDKVGSYMIGQFTISLIAGCSAFVALTVLDAAAPLPLAIMVAVTAIIPLIGATLGAVVSVIVTALATELWPTAVILLGFFIIYQQIENYLIAPRVQRSAVDLSAPAVLLAGIIGGSLQGLLGALMAIPLAATIKVVVLQRIEEHERHERTVAARRQS